MKNLNEMTAKELKEIAKEMKISNWWNLKKAVLIEKIEEAQNMTEEEKQEIADQKAKEDTLFEHYSKNWAKYGPKNDWVKFLEKYKAGKIELVEDIFEEKPGVEELEEVMVEEDKLPKASEEEKECAPILVEKNPKEEAEPFVYTDADGEEWEDYEIGEKIKNWSVKKKAAFAEVYNGLDDFDVDKWSKEWDKEHGIEADKKKKEKSSEGVKRPSLRIKEITYKGETKTIREWADELGMDWPTLYDRINRNGWTVEEAIETPLGQRRKK